MPVSLSRTRRIKDGIGGALIVLGLTAALAVSGCTAAPAGSDGAHPSVTEPRTIAVSLDHPPVEYQMITERSTTGREAARGAGEGIGAGALLGLYMTLELATGTGGFALIAAPFIVGGGALIGGVVGAADGAAGAMPVTVRTELLGEVEGAISLVAALDDSSLAESLRAAIASGARERTGAQVDEVAFLPSGSPTADVEIVVTVLLVEFRADDEDDPDMRLALSAMVQVTDIYGTRTENVLYKGRRDDLSDWAADDASRFREELASALDDLARDIVSQALLLDADGDPRSCC